MSAQPDPSFIATTVLVGTQPLAGSRGRGGIARALVLGASGVLLLLTGCASETLLHAAFGADTIGAPPLVNQATGTVSLDEGAGTVRVVGPPPSGAGQWVQIKHPTAQTAQTALLGQFSQFRGDGSYGLLAVLFIPSGSGVVTIQFEPFGRGPQSYLNFLHLDFLTNNTVRIDDGRAAFGSFPRDRPFTVSVTLNITASGATAHMTLLGGATGELDYTVNPAFLPVARQFGAVRFWMGFQHAGSFDADEILVTRKN